MTKGQIVRYSDKYQLAHPNGWRNGQIGTVLREVDGAPGCVVIRWMNGGVSSASCSDLVKATKIKHEALIQGDLF